MRLKINLKGKPRQKKKWLVLWFMHQPFLLLMQSQKFKTAVWGMERPEGMLESRTKLVEFLVEIPKFCLTL